MGRENEYRCVATTVDGFVQQLAVSYLKNRYWFYVPGEVPLGKDPTAIDEKLVRKYDIGISKWARARRKKRGHAKLQYLRYGRTFVVVATHGEHPFFDEERESILDARERPFQFHGYSVGYKGGHAHVRIQTARYEELKHEFLAVALTASVDAMATLFARIRFEPYGPVKQQVRKLLWKVNGARREAGLEKVPLACLRTKRHNLKPFGEPEDAARSPTVDGVHGGPEFGPGAVPS
jgi:hypothetical protein